MLITLTGGLQFPGIGNHPIQKEVVPADRYGLVVSIQSYLFSSTLENGGSSINEPISRAPEHSEERKPNPIHEHFIRNKHWRIICVHFLSNAEA